MWFDQWERNGPDSWREWALGNWTDEEIDEWEHVAVVLIARVFSRSKHGLRIPLWIVYDVTGVLGEIAVPEEDLLDPRTDFCLCNHQKYLVDREDISKYLGAKSVSPFSVSDDRFLSIAIYVTLHISLSMPSYMYILMYIAIDVVDCILQYYSMGDEKSHFILHLY